MRFLGFFFFWEAAPVLQIYARFTHNLKKRTTKGEKQAPLGSASRLSFLPIFPRHLCFLPKHRIRNALAGGFIGLGDQVGIDVRGGAHPGMAQPFGDGNAIRVAEIQQTRHCVPKFVGVDGRQPFPLGKLV